MKYVICSDLHADARTAGYPRFGDVDYALMEVCNYAIKWGADYFIFAGDLCDPDAPNLIRCIRLAQRVAGYLNSHSIRSYWMAGNHDTLEDGYGTTTLDPIQSSYSQVITNYQCETLPPIGFLPYTALKRAYDPEKTVQTWKQMGFEPKLIVSHLMLEGISVGSETEDFPRGRDVFTPIDTIRKLWPDVVHVAAHYHRRETYKGVEIVGSLVRLTRSEAQNEPCFLALDIP